MNKNIVLDFFDLELYSSNNFAFNDYSPGDMQHMLEILNLLEKDDYILCVGYDIDPYDVQIGITGKVLYNENSFTASIREGKEEARVKLKRNYKEKNIMKIEKVDDNTKIYYYVINVSEVVPITRREKNVYGGNKYKRVVNIYHGKFHQMLKLFKSIKKNCLELTSEISENIDRLICINVQKAIDIITHMMRENIYIDNISFEIERV